MASKYKRQLVAMKVTANFKQRDEEVEDYGAYHVLECQGRRLKTQGAQGFAKLEHSATTEPDSWVPIPGAQWDLNTTTSEYVSVMGFLRYIRVVGDASADGTAVFQLDIVAKE